MNLNARPGHGRVGSRLAEGPAGEDLERGSWDSEQPSEGDDRQALLAAGDSPLTGEPVRGGATDAQDLRGFLDGEEVGEGLRCGQGRLLASAMQSRRAASATQLPNPLPSRQSVAPVGSIDDQALGGRGGGGAWITSARWATMVSSLKRAASRTRPADRPVLPRRTGHHVWPNARTSTRRHEHLGPKVRAARPTTFELRR